MVALNYKRVMYYFVIILAIGKQLNNGIKIHDHVQIEDLMVKIQLDSSTCSKANFLIVGVMLQSAAPVSEQRIDNNFYPVPLRAKCTGKFRLALSMLLLCLFLG